MRNCIFLIFALVLTFGSSSCSKQVCPTYMTVKEVNEMEMERLESTKKVKKDRKGRVKGRHKYYNR